MKNKEIHRKIRTRVNGCKWIRNVCACVFMCYLAVVLTGCGLLRVLNQDIPYEEIVVKIANGEDVSMEELAKYTIFGVAIEPVKTIVGKSGEILCFDVKSGQYYDVFYYSICFVCDKLKSILKYVFISSISLGIILRLLFRNSAKIRKIAVVFFIFIVPIFYTVSLYFICYAADYWIT